MKISSRGKFVCLILLGVVARPFLYAGDTIPKAAWKRGIGLPLENPGGRKPALASSGMIDDGYWQGAPVGGFGAGTFSRTYRGDFSRWHIKSGVHKYQTVHPGRRRLLLGTPTPSNCRDAGRFFVHGMLRLSTPRSTCFFMVTCHSPSSGPISTNRLCGSSRIPSR